MRESNVFLHCIIIHVGLYIYIFFPGSIEFARMSWLVMFGSSRYVVNRRGLRGSSEFPEPGKEPEETHSDDLATATSIVCAHDVFRRNLLVISSTLYRTNGYNRTGMESLSLRVLLPLFRLYRVSSNRDEKWTC